MANKVGTIHIDLKANTANFESGINRAQSKLRELGSHGVTDIQAMSAALRLAGGNLENNIRAAERFLATTLGLGNAIKTVFPLVGAVATLGVLTELITKAEAAYAAFKKMQEAPGRIANGFRDLNQSIALSNDQLRVTNDRLAQDIAKLEGKPGNGLKLALDEARLAADKLAESLAKDLDQVQKLIKEETIGAFKGFFTNRASTGDIEEAFFGKDGYSGFRGKIRDITDSYSTQLREVRDQQTATNLRTRERNELEKAYGEQIDYVRSKLSAAQDAEARYIASGDDKRRFDQLNLTGEGNASRSARNAGEHPTDQAPRIAELQGLLRALRLEADSVTLEYQNGSLNATKAGLEAKAAAAALVRPYADALDELRAKLAAVQSVAAAAHLDDIGLAMARGFAEAEQKIGALNVRLKEMHQQPLGLGQQAEIVALTTRIAVTEEVGRKQKRLDDELKRASEELEAALDRENLRREQAIKTLNEQIAAAEKLRDAEKQGPDAAAQARIDLSAAGTPDEEERGLKKRLGEIEYQAQVAKTVTQLDRETEAQQRLNQVAIAGLAARRQAELENIRASGEAPDVIAARIQAQQTKYNAEDLANLKGLGMKDGARAYFQEMADNAKSAAAQMKEALGTAFEGVNDMLAKLVSGQKVSWASFFQGLSSQFTKMALADVEASFAKRMAGILGKGGGRQPMDEKLPDGSGGVFGSLAGLAGLASGTKRDGQTPGTALCVEMAGGGGAGGGDGRGPLVWSSADDDGEGDEGEDGGGGGGFFHKLLGFAGHLRHLVPFGGGFAAGGDIDPGHAYLVGENGPEMFSPASRGVITPNHKLGGGTIYYTIDARGTDPVLTEQRTRQAIAAAHNHSVTVALRANQEQAKRTPQKR